MSNENDDIPSDAERVPGNQGVNRSKHKPSADQQSQDALRHEQDAAHHKFPKGGPDGPNDKV